jgi:restriction system protein
MRGLNVNIISCAKEGKIMAKNKWVSFFLCLFLGILGVHKFYERRILLGLLYLFTGGLFGVGVVVDLVILFFKPNPYYP